jgi:O-acetyl-ADP-ribose deacetylase (regulator of RNase III)
MSITVHTGSILDADADCIVNPANSFMRHGGGLAAIIAKAASKPTAGQNPFRPGLFEEDCAKAPLIATGDAYWTCAGALPFKGIVHAVGPIWAGGGLHERSLLKSAFANACAVAYDHNCESIAFPAISCGIFGFPVAQAARLAVKAVQPWQRAQPDGLGLDVQFYPFGFEAEFEDALTLRV